MVIPLNIPVNGWLKRPGKRGTQWTQLATIRKAPASEGFVAVAESTIATPCSDAKLEW